MAGAKTQRLSRETRTLQISSAGCEGIISSLNAELFLRRPRRAQAVTFRFAAGEFQLCLPPPPALCGRMTKASALLQRVSKPAQAVHCLFQARLQFVPGVEGNLQI